MNVIITVLGCFVLGFVGGWLCSYLVHVPPPPEAPPVYTVHPLEGHEPFPQEVMDDIARAMGGQ